MPAAEFLLPVLLLFFLQSYGNKHVSWRMKSIWSWCLSVSWAQIIEVCATTVHFSLLLTGHITSMYNLRLSYYKSLHLVT